MSRLLVVSDSCSLILLTKANLLETIIKLLKEMVHEQVQELKLLRQEFKKLKK